VDGVNPMVRLPSVLDWEMAAIGDRLHAMALALFARGRRLARM